MIAFQVAVGQFWLAVSIYKAAVADYTYLRDVRIPWYRLLTKWRRFKAVPKALAISVKRYDEMIAAQTDVVNAAGAAKIEVLFGAREPWLMRQEWRS